MTTRTQLLFAFTNAKDNSGRFNEARFVDTLTMKTVKLQQANKTFSVEDIVGVLQSSLIQMDQFLAEEEAKYSSVERGDNGDLGEDDNNGYEEDVDTRGTDLGRVEEEWMAKKTQEIRESFEKLQEMFRELDKEIAKISSTAVRVGEHLSTLEQHKRRGLEAKEILEYFGRVSKTPSDVISQMLEDEHNLFETAALLRKVIPVVSVLEDTPHTRTGKAQIEAMKAKVETKFTAKFSRALDMRGTKVLRSMAYAMTDFNGGARLVQVYIQTKTSEVQLSQGTAGAAGEAEERDPPGTSAERVLEKEEGRMQDFYRTFIDKIRAEAAFIAEVFPNPQKVMSLLLQSLVEFEVKPFVTRLLSRHADNSLAYVMLLEMVHRISLEQLGGTLRDMFRDAGHTRVAEDIATILNSLFTDVIWADSACVDEFRLPDYMTMEQENLRTLYLTKIRALDVKCARIVAAAASANASNGSGSGPSFLNASSPLSSGAPSSSSSLLSSSPSSAKGSNADDDDALTSMTDAIMMCHENAAAIKRCASIYQGKELPHNAGQIYLALVRGVIEMYALKSVECVSGLLSASTESRVPIKQLAQAFQTQKSTLAALKHASLFLKLAQAVLLGVFSVKKHYVDNVLPCLGSDVNEDSKCRAAEAKACQVLEQAIADGLAKCLTAIRAHARCVLSSFGKNLYNIKEQNFGVVEETPQAKEFVRLVRRLKTEVEQGLDGDNVRVFLTAMGLGIVQEILDSIKAMRITRCGSMILMADAQAYEACLRSFMSPQRWQSERLSLSTLQTCTPSTRTECSSSFTRRHSRSLTPPRTQPSQASPG